MFAALVYNPVTYFSSFYWLHRIVFIIPLKIFIWKSASFQFLMWTSLKTLRILFLLFFIPYWSQQNIQCFRYKWDGLCDTRVILKFLLERKKPILSNVFCIFLTSFKNKKKYLHKNALQFSTLFLKYISKSYNTLKILYHDKFIF